jgi:hypothetical protein
MSIGAGFLLLDFLWRNSSLGLIASILLTYLLVVLNTLGRMVEGVSDIQRKGLIELCVIRLG